MRASAKTDTAADSASGRGFTCLWQVNGRCDTPFQKWMELDMQYIDNWSLALDLKILLKTIPAVVRGSGAT